MPGSCNSRMAAPLGLRVDAKSAFTLERFSGKEEAWPNWCVRAEGHFGMLGWTDLMEGAIASAGDFSMESLDDQANVVARDLYNVLIQRVGGKAFNIVMMHKGNHAYAGSTAGRKRTLLRVILNPGEEWAKMAASGKNFSEVLGNWDLVIVEYESASGWRIDGDELVATVLEHAPPDIKRVLRMRMRT